MQADLYLCGWRVSSEIALPALPLWDGDNRAPDVCIIRGTVARNFIADPRQVTLQTGNRDLCRFYVPGAAAFEIRQGREVVADIEPGARPGDVVACISGTLLGLLCLLRDLLPLHGSCVRMGRGAVCLTGHSGAGKSTLAAALARHGYPLLSDDVCAIRLTPEGPVVLPSVPALRLADRSVEAAAAGDTGEHLDDDREKQHWRLTPGETSPVALAAVYRLDKTDGSPEAATSEQRGAASVILLQGQIFAQRTALELGLVETLFSTAAQVCSATPVRILSRPFDLNRLSETVHLLEALHC